MRTHRRSLLFLVVASTLCCARDVRAQDPTIPLPAADQAVLDKKLGAGVVGAALPSAPLADPSLYFPLHDDARSYYVTDGADAGETVRLGVGKGKRPNGAAAWRFQLTPTVSAFLHATANGDLMVTAMTDTDEGLVVVTTPASAFLVKGMQPGATVDFSQTVSINYLDDPSDQKYSGTLTGSTTYVGTYRVTVPAGVYDAVLVRHVHSGKIGPANTTDTSYYLLAPNVGIVAMITQEDIEAFWIVHIDTSTGKVLASAP